MKQDNLSIFKLWKAVGLLCLLFFCITGMIAQDMSLPTDLQLKLFSKILSFDKNLETRAADSLRIAVVYQKLYRNSDDVMDAVFQSAEKIKPYTINNLAVCLVACDIHDMKAFQTFLDKEKIDIVYIAPLRAVSVREISGICRNSRVLTITGMADYMAQGVSVGLDVKGERPEILINPDAARQEGADFSSRLLNLARIINQ